MVFSTRAVARLFCSTAAVNAGLAHPIVSGTDHIACTSETDKRGKNNTHCCQRDVMQCVTIQRQHVMCISSVTTRVYVWLLYNSIVTAS